MRTITLFNTSIGSDNIGDEIIIDAVQKIIHEVFSDAFVYTVATHEYMTGISKNYLRKSEFSLVAGTNLLASNMEARVLWKLFPWDAFAFNHAVLLGCGWLTYMNPPNMYSRWLLRRVLSPHHLHAVRDEYTKEKMLDIRRNVVNTSCPTMWELTPEHCATVSTRKAKAAVLTYTHHRANIEADRRLATLVKRHYGTVYFWPQQREDLAYFESLGVQGFQLVDPSLWSFDELLENNDIDFIGTRLHGGIRALQKRRRALIISVDNRAAEITKDTDLPTAGRTEFDRIEKWIENAQATIIRLPQDAIDAWKAQFR